MNTSSSSSSCVPRGPPYRPATPSPTVTVVSRMSDDELRRKGRDDLLHLIRSLESENKSLMFEHSSIMKDVNRRLQIHLLEIRGLKEVNQKLQDDNLELRDLCCFLDDDRQKGRKLAREWQRFGRYTSSVMRSEVVSYQDKLKELELRQEELINDNVMLKELCLYLGQEHLGSNPDRDEGDGSSNGTVTGDRTDDQIHTDERLRALFHAIPEEAVNYIKQLEDKVKYLEGERRQLIQKMERSSSEFNRDIDLKYPSTQYPLNPKLQSVLEVHQQLEHPYSEAGGDVLDDKEKAIVREMCNVVWRKLGDAGSERSHEVLSPNPVYYNRPLNPHPHNYSQHHPRHPMDGRGYH